MKSNDWLGLEAGHWLRECVKQKCKPRVHSQIYILFFFSISMSLKERNNHRELRRGGLWKHSQETLNTGRIISVCSWRETIYELTDMRQRKPKHHHEFKKKTKKQTFLSVACPLGLNKDSYTFIWHLKNDKDSFFFSFRSWKGSLTSVFQMLQGGCTQELITFSHRGDSALIVTYTLSLTSSFTHTNTQI